MRCKIPLEFRQSKYDAYEIDLEMLLERFLYSNNGVISIDPQIIHDETPPRLVLSLGVTNKVQFLADLRDSEFKKLIVEGEKEQWLVIKEYPDPIMDIIPQ